MLTFSMALSTSFEDSISFEQIANDQYVSRHGMESNSFNPNEKWAYGGGILAFVVNVAHSTVPDLYRLYTCHGLFLGPVPAGSHIRAEVTRVRDTRTFATRRIEIFPQHREKRILLSVQLDFQFPETNVLLEYSPPTHLQYSPSEIAWDEVKIRSQAHERGVTKAILARLDGAMSARKKYFEVRGPPESDATHTLHGLLPKLSRVQQSLSITEKRSCHYWRSLTSLESHASNAAALVFLSDAGMPVVPVVFADLDWKTVASATSLDFAIRFFGNDIKADEWLLREEQTVVARAGRTYQEARVWDGNGNLVACMTEQCLLRGVKRMCTKL